MLDGETYVARSTSKVAPLRRIDQLSNRERNKIERMAAKKGRVYVLDIWDGKCAFVVEQGGEWMTADEWNARETQRESDDFKSGAWLRNAVGEDAWRELTADDDETP